jgi:hypothetical protein
MQSGCLELSMQEIADLRDVYYCVKHLKSDSVYFGMFVTRGNFDGAWVCQKGGCIDKFDRTGRLLLLFKKEY